MLISGGSLQLQSPTLPWEHCIHISNYYCKVKNHDTVIFSVGSVAQRATGVNTVFVKHLFIMNLTSKDVRTLPALS